MLFVALGCGLAPAALAQQSASSRSSGGAAPRGATPSTTPTEGRLLPGTPPSAYRSRLDPRPFVSRGLPGRSLSYWWWGPGYVNTPDLPEATTREENISDGVTRKIETPAESSSIQPMLTLPRP